MWIALKKQAITRDSQIVELKRGDSIPEAENWKNRDAWVKSGHIAWSGPDRDVFPQAKVEIQSDAPPDFLSEDTKEITVPRGRGRPPKQISLMSE
jgi:hypothetical protein